MFFYQTIMIKKSQKNLAQQTGTIYLKSKLFWLTPIKLDASHTNKSQAYLPL